MNNNQFYELATKALTGEASGQEKELLQTCLQQPEYKKLYDWLQDEWSKDVTFTTHEFDYGRGLNLLRNKIEELHQVQTRKRRIRTIGMRIAASFLLLVGIGSALFQLKKEQRNSAIAYITYSVQKGERKIIELPDGTHVHLNGGSSISFPKQFQSQERDIRMKGEAFFDVTKNPKWPFVIHTGNFTTTVLGTSFDVEYNDSQFLAVTVRTGKVKVANLVKKEGVLLTKGMRTTCTNSQEGFITQRVDPNIYTAWLNNILRFDDISTEQAFEKMEKWYNVQIQCSSTAILSHKINAVYRNESLKEVVNDLQFMIGFNYLYKNDSTICIK